MQHARLAGQADVPRAHRIPEYLFMNDLFMNDVGAPLSNRCMHDPSPTTSRRASQQRRWLEARLVTLPSNNSQIVSKPTINMPSPSSGPGPRCIALVAPRSRWNGSGRRVHPCIRSAPPLFRPKHLASQSCAGKQAKSAQCCAATVGRLERRNRHGRSRPFRLVRADHHRHGGC